jgi:signal transduction histidine kinase
LRLGLKSTLLLLAGYAVLLAGFAFGVDHWLRSFEANVTTQTVTLLAREKAGILSERTIEALTVPDAASRKRLRERIQEVVILSEIVSSITVVDRDGKVVASDHLPVGQQLAKPADLFAGGGEIKAEVPRAEPFLREGDAVVSLRMVGAGDTLLGYVQISFHDSRVADLYSSARRELMVAALVGLAGIVLLGTFLELQLSRRAATIARTLEDALSSPQANPLGLLPRRRDEFSRALEAAGRARKALNEARQESSRLHQGFGALAQVMKMGVVLVRRDKEVEFANPRALELFRVTSQNELEALWPEVLKRLESPLAQAGARRNSGAFSAELPTGAGACHRLRVEIYRLGGEDCEDFLVLLNDPDILDSLETEVRLARQLGGLARVYRTVAHELRAPLSAMMINLELLNETLSSSERMDTKDRQERYVIVLREELNRLNRSLSEILTQTMPPSDPQEKFDLRPVLDELGTLLAPQARKQEVQLTLFIPQEPVLIVGHRDRLKQAFLNISVNALEAMPRGGDMTIDMKPRENLVRISIRDTGSGIPPEILAQIYDREFTTKGSGSGIGLYVARALVEFHGGEIGVESEEGRGTQVDVDLPIRG